MNLSFPISPEQIREGIAGVIKEIKEKTNWSLERDLSDVSISLGEAPEYGQNFGTVREPSSIIFGSWLDLIEPNIPWFDNFEFLIIRESFAFFFHNEVLFGEIAEVIASFLNILSISYLRLKYDRRAMENKLSYARSRFLHFVDEVPNSKGLINTINELSFIVITQAISYQLIRSTLLHFIEDIQYEELDADELFDYILRYLSNSSEEIVSPLRLKERTLKILERVVELGFAGSICQIAESLGLVSSTISRELNQFATLYQAKFRVEKNFYKLGLHYHQIIIRFEKNNNDVTTKMIDELKSIQYIGEIYTGIGDKFSYVYCVTMCPYIVAENLSYKLQRYQKNNLISNFEVKPTKNKIFKTTLIGSDFRPNINNYKKLLSGEISCLKLKTWDNSRFEDDIASRFSANESKLLRLMSVYQSNGIVRYNDYKVFQTELLAFLEDNGYDPKKYQECISFLNDIRNILLDRHLIDFRLQLIPTSLSGADRVVLKINCNPEDPEILSLLERLSVFSYIVIYIGFEDVIFSVFGLNYLHPITKLLITEIEESGFELECFSMVSKVWRYVPLEKLYSYQDGKWFLN